MPSNASIDSTEITSLAVPYSINKGLLSEDLVFNSGTNVYTTWGGTTKKRPPIMPFGPVNRRDTKTQMQMYAARLYIYTTLDDPHNVYVVGSFFNPATTYFEVWWAKIDGNNPTDVTDWIKAEGNTIGGDFTTLNLSTIPHDGVTRRGKFFIKAFPDAETVANNPNAALPNYILDGTGGNITVHLWGALGPQSPMALTDPGTWSASANPVTVQIGWVYTYTWQKESLQETNHAPLQTNPSLAPSSVGAFTNAIPTMTGTAPADNAEFPLINIYRTLDGGGTFFFLHAIANNGSGTFTFSDTFQASGAGGNVFQDPVADANMNTALVSPTTQSNSPPPTVSPPLVTGTDTPQQNTSRIVEYASRLWYGINEYLFYSALEELNSGVPEECFPSGVALPNFFRFSSHIAHVISMPMGLLVTLHSGQTIRINGTAKSTFNPQPFLGGVGGTGEHKAAATEAREYATWMTQDFRVAVAQGLSYAVVSNPLGNLFQKENVNVNTDFQMAFWTDVDKEWLIVGAMRPDDSTQTVLHIYDFQWSEKSRDDFWSPPWKIRATALTVGQSSEEAGDNKLFVAIWDGTNMQLGILDKDFASGTMADLDPTTQAQDITYGCDFTLALQQVAAGDHVNERVRPDGTWPVKNVAYERTVFGTAGESDAQVSVFYDDFFTTPVQLSPPSDPPRRTQSLGYKTVIHNDALRVCKHVGVRLTWPPAATQVEVHQLYVGWQPGAGD